MDDARALAKAYRFTNGRKFRLSTIDPADTGQVRSKQQAQALLRQGVARLSEQQALLYAQDRWALLLIFQAMDAAGKDGAIRHVMSGVNPQGCQVYTFKAPSNEELDHDYLWRTTRCLPERGRIGVFNRSYYEEVLVVRVRPELLARQKLPASAVTPRIWRERFQDINAFERYLGRNGVLIRKFFLHVSYREQKKRLLARLDEPEKHWKFDPRDLEERQRWHSYMEAYEEMIRRTATAHAPWTVVPADKKWFARLVVSATIVDALEELKLSYPRVSPERRRELNEARALLAKQK